MRQHGDEHWCGHREITRAAVGRLFQDLAGPGGRIRGVDERRYADQVDKAQAYQDRLLGIGLIRNFANSGLSIPYVGPGPTTHSAWINPEVQRLHFMADPYRPGAENLRVNAGSILAELGAARRAAKRGAALRAAEPGPVGLTAELPHLGAAAHALQDSYSGAHAWREDSIYAGDPTAAVQSFQVFTPAHVIGIDDGRNTHADQFDKPPARSGSARAAVEATYRMLKAHEEGLWLGPDEADAQLRRVLGPMLRGSVRGVVVNTASDQRWAAERDRRLALEQAEPALPDDS